MANDTPGSDTPPEGVPRPQPDASTSPYARPSGPDGRHQAQQGVEQTGGDHGPGGGYPQGGYPYPAGPGPYPTSRYPTPGQYASPGQYAPTGQYAPPGPYGPGPYGPPAHLPLAGHGYGSPVDRPRSGWRRAALVLVAVLLAGLIGGVVGASLDGPGGSRGVLGAPVPDVGDAPLGPVEAVAERVLPSVVRLLVEGGGAAGEGSGMVLSGDGLMLTNNHVVEAAANGGSIVAVFQDGTTAPAEIVGLDPSSDLAVIRAQNVSGLTPIEFGNSDAVRVGQQVVAVGSPLGLGGTVTAGIVSAVDRAVSVGAESGASEATVLSALQTDAAINPGNSGGPLTDMQGRVIGINSVIATTGVQGGSIGVGFSIPINQARRTAQELEATGTATRAILGAEVNAGETRELAGAVLQSIVPGGPAEQAGLRQGQVVTRVGDRMVSNGKDLIAAIRENAPGDRVTLVVDGSPVDVTLSGDGG